MNLLFLIIIITAVCESNGTSPLTWMVKILTTVSHFIKEFTCKNKDASSTPSWLIPGYVGSTASSSKQTQDILMSDFYQHRKPTLTPRPNHSPTSPKPIASPPLARAYLVPSLALFFQ
ncbi:hypothetical protein M405DRAFT_834489 [Rhizopogon salebrosus TDB-379]|nr:hypothetical protein M405DRAFT_834489 [Rhizopogon salebrosus TDB-379]